MSELKKQGYNSVEAYNKKHKKAQWIVETYKGTLILLRNSIRLHDKRYAYRGDKNITSLRNGLFALLEQIIKDDNGYCYLLTEKPKLHKCYVSGRLLHEHELYKVVIDSESHHQWVARGTSEVVDVNSCTTHIYYLNKEVASECGMEQCKDCERWIDPNSPYCNCSGSHLAGYHDLSRKDLSDGAQFKVGMEIEKEDSAVYNTLYYTPIYNKHKWCIEYDGSLGDYGFEAVSPILPLFDNKVLAKHFHFAKKILNAHYSSRCGGHIHISDTLRSPQHLFDDCAGYYPLLYALYPKRSSREYCEARKKDRMIGKRHSAVNMTGKTLEFRIFPSPKNVATQWWRIGLLRIILKNPRRTVQEVLDDILNVDSDLFKHLKTQYPTLEKYLPKVRLVVDMANNIEGLTLKQQDYIAKSDSLKLVMEGDMPTAMQEVEMREAEQETEEGNPSEQELPAELQAALAA